MSAEVWFATPFRLPDPSELGAAVVVLDIGFCADQPGRSYETVTQPFIEGLGSRLKLWVDHHDHQRHADWQSDPRFVLVDRVDHPACPELITRERVAQAGPIDTIVCHTDYDGIVSAARFLGGGDELYPGCDADARAIDSKVGVASPRAERVAGALAVRHDEAFRRLVLKAMLRGTESPETAALIDKAFASYAKRVGRGRELALKAERIGALAIIDARHCSEKVDRTESLITAQERAPIAVFLGNDGRMTLAAPLSSPYDFTEIFDTKGGMRNRITLPIERLAEVLRFGERLKD
jgi:hypothetical protein